MADEIKKVQKQIAEEQAKRLADEKALREEANKEISKSTNTASKEFKAVINNLAKVRPEAAAIVADFKGLAADSFKGAVLNRDLIKGMEAATEMSANGWSSLSAEQQDLLSEVFGGQIDHIRGLEKQHEEITKAREVQLRKAAMSQQKLSAFEEEQTEFKKSLLEEQQQKVAEAERAMQENQFRNKEKHYEGLLAQEQNRLADLEKQADAQIKEKYGKENIDVRQPLSFTFTITRPSRGSAIGFWGLPEALRQQAEDLQKRYPHDIIERYQNVEYVKEIQKQRAIERPWKYDLFYPNCGDLEQYIPTIIPHTPGNSFFYSGMIIHQMILGDSFKKGDTRITLQGHGLRVNGKYKLFW